NVQNSVVFRSVSCAIYDALAAQAVGVLQKIHEALADERSFILHDSESRSKKKTKEEDIATYSQFLVGHNSLFKCFKPQIDKMLEKQEEDYSPYRVFDKLLWLIGAD